MFKVGDVVVLKSGGPEMTISDIRNNEYCTVYWFVEGKPSYFDFPLCVLEKVD